MAGKLGTPRDVFVGSLPDNINEETIKQLFSTIGDVQSVTIKEGKNNMSNFCFVRYYNEDNAETAIAKLNGHHINGKTLCVRPSGKNRQKTDGGTGGMMNRQTDNRNFQGQRRPQQQQQQGGGYRPWGDAGPDREDIRQWKEESIAVTHIVDANTLYAQICNTEAASAYGYMINQLSEHCSQLPQVATEISPNQVYGAIFSADNGWYRCTVQGSDPATGKMSVLFVDYGNEETVDSVVPLPESLTNIPFFAIKMSLWGLETCFPNKTSENAQKAAELLATLSEAENVRVRIASQQPNPHECSVVIFLDGKNVNESIFNNFADKRPSPAISPVQDGGGHYQGGRPGPQHQQHQQQQQQQGPQQQRNWTASPPSPSDNTAALVGQLQNEKANLIQKVHELKIDLQVIKSAKEIEVNSYKEKVDLAIDYKVATALGSLRRVKKSRSLYPSGENKKAPLEGAIDVLHGGEVSLNGEKKTFRDATPKVNNVEDKLECLSNCQDRIRNCSSKEELSSLISERNQARLEAHQAMSDFLCIADQLPINGRLSDLQDMLNTISNSYPSLVQPLCPPQGSAEEVYEKYRAWLDLKTKKLKSYWKETESALSTWEGLLSSVKESFSLTGDSDFEAQDLDRSIQHLLVAMETELVVSCQDYQPHISLNPEILKQREAELQLEKEVLKDTVQTVLRDTGEEATRLRQLATHCMRYKGLVADLEGWLEATPNIDTLQSLQKTIKAVRSKLRHLLVDLRDGEEDPDLLGDKSLDELKGDIATYQQQLLDHYLKEDELLSNLSKLTKEHFPELAMLHTNLGLEKYIETDGLIKEGRDLMHFNLTAFPSCNKTTTKLASIGGKGVAVIKSQHLPDRESQRRYLERVQLYKTIGSPLLLPVYGIVPDTDSSQYHLQLWYQPMGSLSEVMTSESALSESEVLARLKDILLALQTLHSIQFFHGAVHPNNVLFKSREEVFLADYDFSKLPVDHGKTSYTSSNGLCFQAPEIKHGMAASTASDIFSFGILVLWTHYPTSPFTTQTNGTPDLAGLPIPRDLVDFVVPMLHPNPTNRPNVRHILDFGYLDRLVGVSEQAEDSISRDSLPEGGAMDGGHGGNVESQDKEEISLVEAPVQEVEGGYDVQTAQGGHQGSSEEGRKTPEVAAYEEVESTENVSEEGLMDAREGAQQEEQPIEREERYLDQKEGSKQTEEQDREGSDVDNIIKSPPSLTNGSVRSEEELQDGSSCTPPPLLDD